MDTAKGIVIRHFKHPAELPPEYQQLFDLSEAHSLDQGLPWYRNLVETVYPDNGVLFIAAEIAGSPQAILPVRVTPGDAGRPGEAVSLSNFYTWLYAPVIRSTASAAAFADIIDYLTKMARAEGHASALGVMRFAPMDPAAASFGALEAGLRRAGWVPFRYFCFGNWVLDVAGKSWENYLNTRSSELRNTIRRKGNRFAADGGTLEIVCSGEGLEQALAAYQSIYAASWKNEEPFPAFIPGLVRLAAAQGWLRLGIARINGIPVAAQLWLVAHGTANIYKLAYDEKHATYSAGTLLTAHLMHHVMDVDRVSTVDFLSGDDTYKPTWMSARRERWGIVAYNPRTLGGLAGLMREIAGRGVKRSLARLKVYTSVAGSAISIRPGRS